MGTVEALFLVRDWVNACLHCGSMAFRNSVAILLHALTANLASPAVRMRYLALAWNWCKCSDIKEGLPWSLLKLLKV